MPYVREMDLWNSHFKNIKVVAPLVEGEPSALFSPYKKEVEFISIPAFNVTSWKNIPLAIWGTIQTFFTLLWEMRSADHIHLRCPGNIGLIAVFAQLFFPHKTKTVKYAGNWDWNSQQPISYRIQQCILRSPFFTKKIQVLVYGEWPDRTQNIKPFFTASYREAEKEVIQKQDFSLGIRLCFIGRIDENKNPFLSLEVTEILNREGVSAQITFCGDGPLFSQLKKAIDESEFKHQVSLLGSVDAEKVKKVMKDSHFLVFVSKSEGWPKVVAESMFWGCLPLTSRVSCVPFMVGENQERGILLSQNPKEVVTEILGLVKNTSQYKKMSESAMNWSRTYTLERFEVEIDCLLKELN